ncbi:hypothetical protein RR46_02021 [Papilio xuthus]|uniref:Uncharacterized protein n=1 Tax=Papilio xuthus TaxID=66420 RepID=A0A194QP57_PAPXU|nr:hypothetical protein RR46_02021 [Papilio xuthus]
MRNRFRSRSRSEGGTPPLRTSKSRKRRRGAGRSRDTSASSDSDSERSSVCSRKRYSRLGSDRKRRHDRVHNRSLRHRRRVDSSDTDRDRSCVRIRERSNDYRCEQPFRPDERRRSRSRETSMKETLNAIMTRLSNIEQKTADTSSMPSQRDNTPQGNREPFVTATQALADTILKMVDPAGLSCSPDEVLFLQTHLDKGSIVIWKDLAGLSCGPDEELFLDPAGLSCGPDEVLFLQTHLDKGSIVIWNDAEAGPSSVGQVNVAHDDSRDEDEAVPRDGARSGEAV